MRGRVGEFYSVLFESLFPFFILAAHENSLARDWTCSQGIHPNRCSDSAGSITCWATRELPPLFFSKVYNPNPHFPVQPHPNSSPLSRKVDLILTGFCFVFNDFNSFGGVVFFLEFPSWHSRNESN